MATKHTPVRIDEEGQDFDPHSAIPNWGWMLGAVGVGVALIALAFLIDWRTKDNLLPSLFLDLGTASFLAAVLFQVERRFARRPTAFECRIADPPSWLELAATYDGNRVWRCKHTPDHRWDEDGQWKPKGQLMF